MWSLDGWMDGESLHSMFIGPQLPLFNSRDSLPDSCCSGILSLPRQSLWPFIFVLGDNVKSLIRAGLKGKAEEAFQTHVIFTSSLSYISINKVVCAVWARAATEKTKQNMCTTAFLWKACSRIPDGFSGRTVSWIQSFEKWKDMNLNIIFNMQETIAEQCLQTK